MTWGEWVDSASGIFRIDPSIEINPWQHMTAARANALEACAEAARYFWETGDDSRIPVALAAIEGEKA